MYDCVRAVADYNEVRFFVRRNNLLHEKVLTTEKCRQNLEVFLWFTVN